jgi:hypothetical protein
MQNTFRNYKPLAGRKFDGAALQINEQLPLYDVEEFVIVGVLVPVILALHDSETNHRVIHLTERLVVPLVRACIRERLLVDNFEGFVIDVQAGVVSIIVEGDHDISILRLMPIDVCSTPEVTKYHLTSE